MTNCANVAATIHANMCNDPGFGYSQGERYGTSSDRVTWNIDGRNYTVNRGDYDCSSSVCTAWQKALEGTAYQGKLDAASYTGNMRSVFLNSGLFDLWNTNSTSAVRGDVYLKDGSHTAICQSGSNPDTLSEFSINERGGTQGGRRGDQTGRESWIHGYYDYPWSCTLHYNGKADNSGGGGVQPTPSPSPIPVTDQPLYAIRTGQYGWLPAMRGLKDTSGGSDDFAGIGWIPALYIAIGGVGKYRVCTRASGWLPYVDHFDINDLNWGCAGDGSEIIALEIPNGNIKYQVHVIGGDWYPWMKGTTDTGGSSDHYAGDMSRAIDAVRIIKA